MGIENYLQEVLPKVNQSILENDYNWFDSFFADDIEEDDLESQWPEISREHNEELGKLLSFQLIEQSPESENETRLTYDGVFDKDSAVIRVLVRSCDGKDELLEHTYTLE